MAARATTLDAGEQPASSPEAGPLAIKVEELSKTFRIPTRRVDTLKERALHPFARREYHELHALDGISFDIGAGEFFGIVGRNGSGKSTLLKILASIYRADSGAVWMAGRHAPFIELGVGFNMELTARDNIALNGVMVGLTPREARGRLDTVMDFAELGDFVDLKLKNYSSGMLVRLAFSLMIQSDADILLIDEVLAVGDASFQQKCADVFHEMRRRDDQTVVLVTHDMSIVEEYCHRALLLSNGGIEEIGKPSEVARRYLALNFEQHPSEARFSSPHGDDVRFAELWLEGPDGERTSAFEHGRSIGLRAVIEADRDVPGALFGLQIDSADGVTVFQLPPQRIGDSTGLLAAGTPVELSATLENPLADGHYAVHVSVAQNDNPDDAAAYAHHALDFVVFGIEKVGGLVSLSHEVEVTPRAGKPR